MYQNEARQVGSATRLSPYDGPSNAGTSTGADAPLAPVPSTMMRLESQIEVTAKVALDLLTRLERAGVLMPVPPQPVDKDVPKVAQAVRCGLAEAIDGYASRLGSVEGTLNEIHNRLQV
jgi:hypothetical protein